MNYTELCETILEDYGRYWIENIPNDCNSITNINFSVSYYIYTNTYISLKLL